MSKSLIFLQAPLKMPAVLNCYERERALGNEVVIVLPARLQCMSQFVNFLKIDCEVIVLETMIHISLLNVPINKISILRNKILIRNVAEFNSNFFFTDIYDPDLALLLKYVSYLNPTHIQSKIDIQVGNDYERLQRNVSFFNKLLAKLFSKIYYSDLVACKDGPYSFFTFDNRKYRLPAIDLSETSIVERYRIKTIVPKGKSVIFYSNPNEVAFCSDEEYGRVCRDVVQYLQRCGYFVAAKGHPRAGSEKHVEELCDYVIPNYIPAEFIDLTQFEFAIGFFSTALLNASFEIKGYSLVKIPKINDISNYNHCIAYFNNYDNQISFIERYEDMLIKE